MSLSPDTLVQERYRIIRQIGQGSMGAVYEANDEHLANTVALKQTLARGDQFGKAFEREAKLLAELRHPVLPRVIDYFTNEQGQFMVMDYFPDHDLGALLKQRGDPFLVSAVLRWADQVLHALEYMHRQKPPVIHRDIKPQNLKLTPEGQIVLLDFGLAKASSSLEHRGYHKPAAKMGRFAPAQSKADHDKYGSTTDNIYGFTRQYAPIEQILGIGNDARSDIYAMGATLYHLLTGTPPDDALTRVRAFGFDNYSHYEVGLERLFQQLDSHAESYQQALAYDQQLRDTIAYAREHGDTPENQEQRADLLDQLNTIAREELDTPFFKLCSLPLNDTPAEPGTTPTMPDTLRPAHEVNPLIPEAVSKVLHKALSLQPEKRHHSAEAMRVRLHTALHGPTDAAEAVDEAEETTPADNEAFLPPYPDAPPRPRRRREKAWIIPTLVIIIVLITQIWLMVARRQDVPLPETETNGTPTTVTTIVPIHNPQPDQPVSPQPGLLPDAPTPRQGRSLSNYGRKPDTHRAYRTITDRPTRGCANRSWYLGRKRRAHLSRCPDRHVAKVQPARTGDPPGLSAKPTPGLGMVYMAARTGRQIATQPRPRGPGGHGATDPTLYAYYPEC